MELVDVDDRPRRVVLLADALDDVDFTGGNTLVETASSLAERGVSFAIATPTRAVRPELDRFGVTAAIGADHIYDTLDEAIAAFQRDDAANRAGVTPKPTG